MTFVVSVSQEAKHEKSWKISGKIRSEIRRTIRGEDSKNSGTFRSAPLLTKLRVIIQAQGPFRGWKKPLGFAEEYCFESSVSEESCGKLTKFCEN